MAEDSETLAKDDKEVEEKPQQDIESQINTAMRARIAHFKEQSDSLTFEGVRRLLEKDLGLETFTLDVHKRFIKQLLQELLESNEGDDSKNHEESEENRDNVGTGGKGEAKEEQEESPGGPQQNSPVLGLLTGQKTTKVETEGSKGVNEKNAPTKGTIEAAIWKRAQYLKDKSEQLTLAGLRRVLEKDLELEMYSLDPFKKFINEQVDKVLNSAEESKPAKSAKKNTQRKVAKKVSNKGSSDSTERESDEDEDVDADEDEVKPKKKFVRKGKDNNEPKKRKRPTKDTNISGKKRIKAAETLKERNSDADDNGNVSEDGDSQSSTEKSKKKKVVAAPAYGKRVEHLKTVIKACGLSVPPAVYKKVKQVPENKRESQLIKELEEILSKEGLSANPSEKEIKEVRKKKERAKELEGIDTSNIVSSTRRRSTTSFVAPPKPKMPVENDGENTDDDDDDDGDDHDDDDHDDDDHDEDDDNGNSEDNQSEESNADNDDDDENSD